MRTFRAAKTGRKITRATARNVTPADPTTQYALDVVAGRIVAGKLVICACKRHLDDLKNGPKRGLIWRPEKAQHVIDFFPAVLQVTAGAKEGQPFTLLPWMLFCAGSLFGWHRTDGLRRFRKAWLETGKGQAKSPFMAAIGLYFLAFAGIKRPEVYAIAGDKDQANVLFKDAVAMCRATIPGEDEGDTLETRGAVLIRGTSDNAWKIEHPASGGKFQALASGEAISGPRPALVLADEIHEMKTNTALELWAAAILKMSGDALMLLGTNTPALNQAVGTEYSGFYQRVAKGEFHDDTAFAYIARTDPEDDPLNDEGCWSKALPALGITYEIEKIRGEVNTAKGMPSRAISLKRLFFGIPTGAAEFWISEEAWQASQGRVDERTMRGKPCYLSLDLSKKNDLTALSAAWVDGAKTLIKTWYWTTKVGLADRVRQDQAPYDSWVESKHLTPVPGAVIDYSFVVAQVARICAEHDVRGLAFDVAFMNLFLEACEAAGFAVWQFKDPDEPPGEGLMLIAHAQGKRIRFDDKQLCMPTSITALEDGMLAGNIVIDESPVTTNCAANSVVEPDGQGNRSFDKARSRGRIDGMVTIAMAAGFAASSFGGETVSGLSIYDRPELWQ